VLNSALGMSKAMLQVLNSTLISLGEMSGTPQVLNSGLTTGISMRYAYPTGAESTLGNYVESHVYRTGAEFNTH